MLDKYFGFINLSLDTEEAVIEAFIEHTDLDKTEHQHLVAMLRGLWRWSTVKFGPLRWNPQRSLSRWLSKLLPVIFQPTNKHAC